MYKLAYLFFVTIFILSCSQGNTGTDDKKPATAAGTNDNLVRLSSVQAKNAGIVTGQPVTKEIHKVLKVSGVLDVLPDNMISVSIPLGGYIKKMSLIPGQQVHTGEILATVEDQQYIQLQQDYLTAKSKLTYYEAEYYRQLKLNETKAVSDKTYQLAKSEFESEKILFRSLGEKLRLIGINPEKLNEDNISRSIYIKAPISGFITKVNVNPGKYASPTDILFELQDPAELHLTLTVFENDAAALTAGQKIICFTNTNPGKRYEATIHYINPNIDKERSTEVHCHISGYGNELLPGMFMNSEIEIKKLTANTLPEEAVVKWNNIQYIFSEAGENTYKMYQIETGMVQDGSVEIKSTLPNGKIVIKNAYTLLMKMKNNSEE